MGSESVSSSSTHSQAQRLVQVTVGYHTHSNDALLAMLLQVLALFARICLMLTRLNRSFQMFALLVMWGLRILTYIKDWFSTQQWLHICWTRGWRVAEGDSTESWWGGSSAASRNDVGRQTGGVLSVGAYEESTALASGVLGLSLLPSCTGVNGVHPSLCPGLHEQLRSQESKPIVKPIRGLHTYSQNCSHI